jgi:two-component system, OmpR family, phosphate regulon response regulator OmpR
MSLQLCEAPIASRAPARDSSPMNETVTPRLLLLEDDARLRELLQRYLQEQGFDVSVASNTAAAEKILQRQHIDAWILDLMLPGEDGLSFLKRMRAQNDYTPAIMLTARGDDVDRIVGLELGADDYLPKPCNPRELVARLRAIMRRRNSLPAGAPQAELGDIRFGDCWLEAATRTLHRSGADARRLTTGEFALLSILVRHPNQPLSRDRLLSLMSGRDMDPFERSIDVAISKLRKFIEPDPRKPRYLQTVWGMGYVYVPE